MIDLMDGNSLQEAYVDENGVLVHLLKSDADEFAKLVGSGFKDFNALSQYITNN